MATIHEYLVALGGNMPSEAGSAAQTLRAALDAMEREGARICAVSAFYNTPCFPVGAGPDYVNAAARIALGCAPDEALALLHRVEAQFGRTRARRWGRRTLDLDLIAQGAQVLPDQVTFAEWRNLPVDVQEARAPDQLILPHPRLQDRAFVLGPMCDIAPAWRHPVTGRSTMQMWAALHARDRADITPF